MSGIKQWLLREMKYDGRGEVGVACDAAMLAGTNVGIRLYCVFADMVVFFGGLQ